MKMKKIKHISVMFFLMAITFMIYSCDCKEADFSSLFDDVDSQNPCSGYTPLEFIEVL